MISAIIGITLVLASVAGISIFFFFFKAVVEEHAYNKESNKLWKKYYAQFSLSK